MPMVPTPWKLRPWKPPGKTSLTPRGRHQAGPQRYRVGGVGPNAFHDMSPGPAAMARALGVSRRGDAGSSKPSAVMPRESGASSTPRLLDSGLAASGILDHPLLR